MLTLLAPPWKDGRPPYHFNQQIPLRRCCSVCLPFPEDKGISYGQTANKSLAAPSNRRRSTKRHSKQRCRAGGVTRPALVARAPLARLLRKHPRRTWHMSGADVERSRSRCCGLGVALCTFFASVGVVAFVLVGLFLLFWRWQAGSARSGSTRVDHARSSTATWVLAARLQADRRGSSGCASSKGCDPTA